MNEASEGTADNLIRRKHGARLLSYIHLHSSSLNFSSTICTLSVSGCAFYVGIQIYQLFCMKKKHNIMHY